MKKIIIIISLFIFLSGCAPINSTIHEFSDSHQAAIKEICIGLTLCDGLKSAITLNKNINYEYVINTYNQYLSYKKYAIDKDSDIVNYKGSGLFKTPNIHEKVCECEKAVNLFIDKKKKEIEIEHQKQEEKYVNDVEKQKKEDERKKQELEEIKKGIQEEHEKRIQEEERIKNEGNQEIIKLGYKGVKWEKDGITKFIYDIKTGKESIKENIKWVFIYSGYDYEFKILQILKDAILYTYRHDAYYPKYEYIDGTVIVLPKEKNELYIEDQPLTKENGSFFAFLGVQEYINPLGVNRQALVFKRVF